MLKSSNATNHSEVVHIEIHRSKERNIFKVYQIVLNCVLTDETLSQQ